MSMPNVPLLESIHSPADLRRLTRLELKSVARELREFLLQSVGKTGGHLSSNLGTVELTIALHAVYNTPEDRLVWDVGHQTYPHKILTGRRERFHTLRQLGGLSGFPRRDESEYDTFGTAHSSTSISAALGMALGAQLKGENRKAVARAMPSAAEIEVEECAVPKVSYSLSSRRGNPDKPPSWRRVWKRSRRPVRILCG